ncbi:PREDICTED: cysteine and histidine-rich domain-containing protein 1-like isoform X2 [Branchiostoma belcheri]|uniref:Cysteine and histidine-rich domain-containing protein 1-like isoform X2 n=1 Tax=Branchiostoma belcheri TaxID=7741 RepID=A0A6P5A0W6_BRABE|nr:PREDICTED: cysteine and histidine-rich domain-containing protein 1-like isoform X2 [Branchiostoma belcheri]
MADSQGLVQCYNKGCGQKFDPRKNNDSACTYHAGEPIFHDAQKSWSCCKKKSTDFTVFLNFPGCTTGCHSNTKPVESSRQNTNSGGRNEVIEVRAPLPKEVMDRPSPKEPLQRLKTTLGASLKQALAKQKPATEGSGEISADGVVSFGTTCKNNACKKTYEDDQSNEEDCWYHPGTPTFHEGYKFWSCCTKRTTDFNEFLSQAGCSKGKHVWIKEEGDTKKVACRFDWHQTGALVVISIYAKVCDPEKTFVEANRVRVKMNVVFDQGNSQFQQDVVLRGMIDVEKSTVNLLGTKVEVKLRKLEPGSWASLDMPGQADLDQEEPQEIEQGMVDLSVQPGTAEVEEERADGKKTFVVRNQNAEPEASTEAKADKKPKKAAKAEEKKPLTNGTRSKNVNQVESIDDLEPDVPKMSDLTKNFFPGHMTSEDDLEELREILSPEEFEEARVAAREQLQLLKHMEKQKSLKQHNQSAWERMKMAEGGEEEEDEEEEGKKEDITSDIEGMRQSIRSHQRDMRSAEKKN